MQKNKLNVQTIARLAAIAALYAALTIALQPISFGLVQLRFSEILVLLCFYRRDHSIALIFGCFIANCFSPMALMDMVFGTLATALAVIPMFSLKNIWLASLLPVVSNAVIIGAELYIAFSQPLWLGMLTVGAGELIVITFVGCPLFRFVLQKNTRFMKIMGSKKNADN
ncbi:MAG: QueT transporter family protein [Oscillospiraceae bacterium]|nr:QueT transporter family protein [Oscillospiraceae bacterium]